MGKVTGVVKIAAVMPGLPDIGVLGSLQCGVDFFRGCDKSLFKKPVKNNIAKSHFV